MTPQSRCSPRALALLALLVFASGSLKGQIKEYGDGEAANLSTPHVKVGLIPSASPIGPGATGAIGLGFQLEEGWHIYWQQPGDSGQAPSLTWVPIQGIEVGPLEFPAPKRLPSATLMAYGYESAVTFPLAVHTNASVKPGMSLLRAHVKWLVCREVCIPGKAFLGTAIDVVRDATGGRIAPTIVDARKAEPQPLPSAFSVTAGNVADLVELTIQTGRREATAEFFPFDQGTIENAARQTFESKKSGGRLTLHRVASSAPPQKLEGVLELSDGRSYLIKVKLSEGGEGAASNKLSQNLGTPLILAFLGGILLNLMPCVFPVLFLKALALLSSANDQRSSQRLHGLAYTAGILISFWVVVAVLLVMRRVGHEVGWGFQLQSPTFVVLMASLLFLMALSLAGQFDLGMSITNRGDGLTRRSGYTGSFFTGVLATVVATPCTGPFMGAAVGFALSQSAFVAFCIFTSLAAGLAFPYFLLTLRPTLARMLPKPGVWMVTMKQAAALPLLCAVAWLVWVYGSLYGTSAGAALDRVAHLLGGLIVLSIAGWTLSRWPTRQIGGLTAVVLVVLSISLSLSSPRTDLLSWQPYSSAALANARSEHRPVFIDFTAAWCLSCQVNERTVLGDAAIDRQFVDQHYVLLRADWTRYAPEITERLASLQRSGVPTYVVYPPDSVGPPVVLPELLTKAVVLDALKNVQSGTRISSKPMLPSNQSDTHGLD